MSAKDLRKGICILRCSKHHDHGVVHMKEIRPNGPVEFKVEIYDISPGKHGFHIHRKGNEMQGSTSLCEHFNPTNKLHGNLNDRNAHVGDLGNLTANLIEVEKDGQTSISGVVVVNFIAERVRLSGVNSIFGRSLIVHENEDDLGKGHYKDSSSTGHSGSRILWGIIGVNDGDEC